jgi:hypothetical protein
VRGILTDDNNEINVVDVVDAVVVFVLIVGSRFGVVVVGVVVAVIIGVNADVWNIVVVGSIAVVVVPSKITRTIQIVNLHVRALSTKKYTK